MAPRGTRVEHYEAIAAFYGLRLLEDLVAPTVPDFVIYHAARRAAHYASAALKMRERPRRPRRAVLQGMVVPDCTAATTSVPTLA